MSGLLDRAKAKREDDLDPKIDSVGGVSSAAEKGVASEGLLATAIGLSSENEDGTPGPAVNPFTIGGTLSLLTGAFSTLHLDKIPFGGWIVLCLFIGGYAGFSRGWKVGPNAGKPLSGKQWSVLAVVWLLVGLPPYFAAWDVDAVSLSVGGFDVDEANNALDFKLYTTGHSGDATITISRSNSDLWTLTLPIAATGVTSVSVPFSKILDGNGHDSRGLESEPYMMKISLSDGAEKTSQIDAALLDRIAVSAGGEIIARKTYQTGDESGIKYLGAQLRMNLGIRDPTDSVQASEGRSSALIRPTTGDYDINLEIVKGESGTSDSRWSHPLVEVRGESVNWAGGTGLLVDGWVTLGGTLEEDGEVILDRNDFYAGDGCYRMKYTVTHLDWPDNMEASGPVYKQVFIDDSQGFELRWDASEEGNDPEPGAPWEC